MINPDEQPVVLRFECTASEDAWEVSGLQLYERLDQPYELRLELRTDDAGAEPLTMLGAPITLSVERGVLHREFSGIVESVEDGAVEQDHVFATLKVVPALMALGQRRTSRIFQEMTIPEILQEVLDEGLGPYERSADLEFLSGEYPAQEYTVQYQETDLDFVHRLMEEYGISYHFTHEDGVETLVLFDSDAAYTDLLSYANQPGVLPMVERGGSPGMREDVREFQRESKMRSTVARTTVFNWLSPAETEDVEDSEVAELEQQNGAELGPEREDYEHEEPATLSGFRTAGLDFAAVEAQVKLRRKLHQRDAVRFVGTSTATGLSPGIKLELHGHPHAEFDHQYLVVSVDHAAGDLSSPDLPEEAYTNRFECIPIEVEWRPDRRTKRPRMPSIQTATVVGPAGEEIHTDEHGRIKIQFHWDRRKQYDEASSCFVRVVQPWAGNGWGFVFLPRIGMEVAVTFIDGDPDRPVVTGCLYNGQNPPPYPLPDDKTKSTIKSESSPGGGGFNELRFEDAAGAEEIYIHAQKDFNEVVLNNHNTRVGNNQTNKVKVNQTQVVNGNQKENVDGNQEMTVGGDRTVHVMGDFDETVDGTETRTVTGDVTESFAANETRDIAADQTETIGGSVTHTITGSQTDTITGALDQTIVGGVTVTTPATYDVTAAGGITMTAAGGIKMIAPAGFTVVAPGGTTTIDNTFWKFGGGQGDAFSWYISLVGLKLEAIGIAALHTNIKLEHVGMSISHTTAANIAAEPAKIETVGQALTQGYASLHTFGLLSIL